MGLKLPAWLMETVDTGTGSVYYECKHCGACWLGWWPGPREVKGGSSGHDERCLVPLARACAEAAACQPGEK